MMRKKIFALIVASLLALLLMAASPKEGFKYVGSSALGKSIQKPFHRFTCQIAQRIPNDRAIYFKDARDAASKGFQPCGICKPD
jgi:hypothetical protein